MTEQWAGRAVAQPNHDWWRPTRSLANWLTWVLAAQGVVAVALPFVQDQAHKLVQWHKAYDALLDGHSQEAGRIYRNANQGFNPWSIIGLVGAAAWVLLIIWMWRSAHNAQALGRTGARLSPGWAIGAWFIPLANLVLLYLLYSDLWRSSDPDSERGDGWRTSPGAPLVRTFWTVHVLGALLAYNVTVALTVLGAIGESTARTLLVLGGIVGAASALLNIFVVREITARQEALQARDPAPTERPFARTLNAPTTVDGPGWYGDPGGRYDHRYWDGSAWTEHVSRGGVADTAPINPADWYPDPTGRFHWRYWTGHEWTEHVSRDGQLFVDPPGGVAPT